MDTRSGRLARPTRRTTAVALALVSALTLLSACLSPSQGQVRTELNADRNANRLTTLPTNADAQAKAQAWANRLARENTLYHSKLSDGIRTRWCSLGENVGYGGTVASIQDAYMRSPGHRANVLGSKWNAVGVGYAKNGNRVFTVQVFIQTC
ncbi:MAG: hypothetical protein JWM47_3708 [Acidimicrobiales bacterium]|nr:hypothetical protein [Acidimicrobiales bacterium]